MELHAKRFPGESEAYRAARNELLQEEVALRKQVEAVAAKRRSLPDGGQLKEDYVFEAMDAAGEKSPVAFSDLFAEGKDVLALYSFMYAPAAESPCPSCTSIMDGLDGNVHYISQRMNLAVCARASIEKFSAWGQQRGWRRLRLLSSLHNTYNADYHAEIDESRQMPLLNVFRKTPAGIFHCYSSELLFAASEAGQDPRHVDSFWPLWNIFDLTPIGRGDAWYPNNSYL